ncbi:MAG: hypothetical protein JZU53_01440 [Paludibacter sp.]|nr:hypothetical protein [Paludibacter sp.]
MKKILLILLCTLAVSVYSQTVRLTYETGYGIYSLEKLKNFQESLSHQINGLPVKMITQFPGYTNHSASIGFYLDKNDVLGINASYLTTGGRNHLSDYSGEYKLDMILNGFQVGIESEHIFNLGRKIDLNANFKLGIIKSNLNVTEYMTIYNLDSKTSTDEYKQSNFFLEPNLSVSYNIIKGIAVKACIGYSLNTSIFNSELIDWSGLRTRIAVSYSL